MNRKPLRRVSLKRRAAMAEQAVVREMVLRRDGYRCRTARLIPLGTHQPLTFHHLRKASAGGHYEPANGLTLCAQCNVWVEDNPDEAHALGLVVRNGETHRDAYERLDRAGIIPLGAWE